MMNLLRALLPKKSPKPSRRNDRRFRPQVECLEGRDTPNVTFNVGPVLPHVEAQALYLGPDWGNSPYNLQALNQENFLHSVVNSSYMDMLTQAGYGVGRGSASGGYADPSFLPKGTNLQDSAIQGFLATDIQNHRLQYPDGNRLYVVYVEDNVVVQTSTGTSAKTDVSSGAFMAYHSWWNASLTNSDGSNFYAGPIQYAVVAYPGGSNFSESGLNIGDTLTMLTSHELAEAVTDPLINAWKDYSTGAEIGDIVNHQTVYLNGYAVQREADQHDQTMTPQGATAKNPVNFYLDSSGNLYMYSAGQPSLLDTGVAYLSGQAIDNYGHAMVDYVGYGGNAVEYHEGQGKIFMNAPGRVKMAVADQGESFLLLTNGSIYEYRDWDTGYETLNPHGSLNYIGGGSWSRTTIDAGTDEDGVNVVASLNNGLRDGYIYYNNSLSEYSDSAGWRWVAQGGNVESFSVGQQGVVTYVVNDGSNDAYLWTPYLGNYPTWLWYGVSQVTAGTDTDGTTLVDMLLSNGNLYQARYNSQGGNASGWNYLDSYVEQISKAVAGFLTEVSQDHYEGYVIGNWGHNWTNLGSFIDMTS